ncbi:hypothetical protein AgCh_000428 [Apium graveolens]
MPLNSIELVISANDMPIIITSPVAPLTSLMSPWPFSIWGFDLIGELPKEKGSVKYVVVDVDYFMKWAEAKPLATITAKKLKEFVYRAIVCWFQWLKIGALVLLLRLNGRPSSITFQSYSVTVENIYAVEVSACPSLVEIKRLPNKVLRWCAGTDNNTMYTMVFSVHTLNDTTFIDDMYAGECQDSTSLNQDLIQGNLHSNFRHTRRKFLNFFIKFAF